MPIVCHRITSKIIVKSPLHIGSGKRSGFVKHGLPYIPGSFIRGATGISLIKLVCKKDEPLVDHRKCEFFEQCDYANLFEKESGKSSKIFFRYAYPTHLPCNEGIYLPSPKTVFVCKNAQCGTGYDRISPPIRCEVCNSRLDSFKGFLCNKCSTKTEIPVEMRRVTSTAIDRGHCSAAQIIEPEETVGMLYALDVINVGSQFSLEIIASHKILKYLPMIKTVLSTSLPDEGIGGSKSRGLGKIEVKDMVDNAVTIDLLEQRAENIDTSHFFVRLLTPMVPKRDELENGQFLSPKKLLEACRKAYTWCFHEGKPSLPDVKHVQNGKRLFSFETYSGWSLKEGEGRKDAKTAVSSGSVFEFKCDRHDETWALALAALEYQAIGDFKPHGCGQIIIEKFR
jgi:CRISPR/Cas system CSM-associated protein Csm3 (group 7 of RAMP superfamily)